MRLASPGWTRHFLGHFVLGRFDSGARNDDGTGGKSGGKRAILNINNPDSSTLRQYFQTISRNGRLENAI